VLVPGVDTPCGVEEGRVNLEERDMGAGDGLDCGLGSLVLDADDGGSRKRRDIACCWQYVR
jgi:hypothetical protein